MEPLPVSKSPAPLTFEPEFPTQSKKPFPVVGIFITLFFLVLIGLLLYQQLQIHTLLTVKSSVTPTITPTPPLDPTANWKTYNNSKFNYMVKYPPQLVSKLVCENEENNFYLVIPPGDETNEPQNCARDSHFNIEISVSSSPIKINDDRYDEVSEDYQLTNIPAKKYTYTQKPDFEGPGESWFIEIIFQHNENYYSAYLRNKELINTFDQILSTFQFNNSSS